MRQSWFGKMQCFSLNSHFVIEDLHVYAHLATRVSVVPQPTMNGMWTWPLSRPACCWCSCSMSKIEKLDFLIYLIFICKIHNDKFQQNISKDNNTRPFFWQFWENKYFLHCNPEKGPKNGKNKDPILTSLYYPLL